MALRVKDQRVRAIVLLVLLTSTTAFATNDEGEDTVRIGGDVTVAEDRVVHDAVAIGGSVTVLSGGHVKNNAVAIGGDVILKENARVEGDTVAIGGEILKERGAVVGGSEVIIASGAKGVVDAVKQWGFLGLLYRAYLISVILHILATFILAAIGVVLLLLAPNSLQIIAATIQHSVLKSGAWGIGGILASFLLSALTTGSLLGVLLVPVLFVAMVVIGILGCVGAGLFVGERMFSASARSFISRFLLGMLILGLLGVVPVVGGVLLLVANIFGFGAVLVSRAGRVQPEPGA
jgi:hypothetical protein